MLSAMVPVRPHGICKTSETPPSLMVDEHLCSFNESEHVSGPGPWSCGVWRAGRQREGTIRHQKDDVLKDSSDVWSCILMILMSCLISLLS